MKKAIYLSVASSILLLASGCSDDMYDGPSNAEYDSGTITISAGTQTRADEAALKSADIPFVMVSADLGKDGVISPYFSNYQFDRVGSKGNYLYKSSRNPIWPPEGTLTFKAYYPSVQEMYAPNYTWEGAVPTPYVDENLVIHNFAVSKQGNVPIDLLTATKDVDVVTTDTKKSVELDLKHQLTSLTIKAFNGSKTKDVENTEGAVEGSVTKSWGHIIEIAGIRIKNIPVVGDFDINSGKWLPEKTKTNNIEYIFQPNDKVLKMGRLGEHSGLVSVRTSGYTFFYNQHDTKEEAVNISQYCNKTGCITMLPTAALPEATEGGDAKEMELQLLIRIIQETDAWDGNHLRKYVAIYPNDIGYRYNASRGYFLHDDGVRYIQSDRDDCAIDGSIPSDSRDQTTIPILLKDDKIENIMEFLVEEKEEGPGDVGKTFAFENYENECWTRGTTVIEEKPDYPIIKDFRIMESAQHYGNGDHYFDAGEIDALRHTYPYAYGDGGSVPKGCIRRFAWLNIPLTVKDKDGNKVKFACEAGKNYVLTLDFTKSLENVTTLFPPDPESGDSSVVDPVELGKFAIDIVINVDDWPDEEEKEEVIPAVGPYTPQGKGPTK